MVKALKMFIEMYFMIMGRKYNEKGFAKASIESIMLECYK